MRISEARRRPVVATDNAETIGHVDGFLIEAEAARITGMRIDGDDSATVLPWDRMTAFGVDAITVASAEALRAPADAGETRRCDPELDPIGKPAIEETGDTLGTVTDVEFDADTGAVRSVLTDVYDIPADKLLGLGAYAMVFSDLHR